MDEVFRACDVRPEREVAIEVLPAEMANDEERLRRYEQEALDVGRQIAVGLEAMICNQRVAHTGVIGASYGQPGGCI